MKDYKLIHNIQISFLLINLLASIKLYVLQFFGKNWLFFTREIICKKSRKISPIATLSRISILLFQKV